MIIKFNKNLAVKILKLKNKINELDNLKFNLKSNRLVDSQVEYDLIVVIGLIYKEKVLLIIINNNNN